MYQLSEKVEQLLAQEEVLKEILGKTSVEEMKAAFAAHGVEITDEELKTIIEAPNQEEEDGALSEDALDTVSGGVSAIVLHAAGLTTAAWAWSCDRHGGINGAVEYTFNWWYDRIHGKKSKKKNKKK